MKIKIALTKDIINQCLLLHYIYHPAGKKSRQKLIWIPIVLLIIAAYLIFTELRQPVLGSNFFLAFLYIAFALGYYIFMRKRMLKGGTMVLKTLQENANFDMDVDEHHLTTFTLTSTLTTRWNELTGALITQHNILLYQADNSFTMFHQSFFGGNDFEVFKTLVRAKIPMLIDV